MTFDEVLEYEGRHHGSVFQRVDGGEADWYLVFNKEDGKMGTVPVEDYPSEPEECELHYDDLAEGDWRAIIFVTWREIAR